MNLDDIRIILVPASDDTSLESDEYQKVLRDFREELRAIGVKYSPQVRVMDAAGGAAPAIYTGALAIAMTAFPVVGKVLVAWIKSRNGRRVKAKVGDINIEASNAQDVEELLRLALRWKKKEPKSRKKT